MPFPEVDIFLHYRRENRQLKRENELLRQERDILKKAIGIFSRNLA
jgi:transposase-like protein